MKLKYKAIIELEISEGESSEATDCLHSVVEDAMKSLQNKEWDIKWTLHPALFNDRSQYQNGSSLQRRRALNQYAQTFEGNVEKKP